MKPEDYDPGLEPDDDLARHEPGTRILKYQNGIVWMEIVKEKPLMGAIKAIWRYRYPLVTAGFAAVIGWQLYEIVFAARNLSALVGAAYFTVLGALLAMLLWDGVQRARGR